MDKLNLRAQKVNNPVWLARMGPVIEKYVNQYGTEGITYQSLVTYFQQVAQFGGEGSEFWVVFDEDKQEPVAFAQWAVLSLPYVGCVHLNHIHSWMRRQEPAKMLWDEFNKFGKKHNAPIFLGYALNEKLFEYYSKVAEKNDCDIIRLSHISVCGVRKNGN